ncbi:MAG: hypothetical protein QOE38_1830 [Thermoleophilaceae bacterium]|nr:hypothetical protein [Thermoleophilaceae bacterium]
MESMKATPEASGATVGRVVSPVPEAARVYVRTERSGRLTLLLWGIEHAGRRSEAVAPRVPGRPEAVWAIERDLRRGVGL